MIPTIMALGLVAETVAWRVVMARGQSIWVVIGLVLAAMGIAAVLAGPPPLSPAVGPVVASAVGAGSGVVLYMATRVFLLMIRGWRRFHRQAEKLYGERGSLSLPAALLVAAGLAVLGEELFWRGLFQARLSASAGGIGGAGLTWGAYLSANLSSGNLPIIAGAIVGGAVWGTLALWTHGVLASVLCHSMWTGLMLSFPPVPLAADMGSSP